VTDDEAFIRAVVAAPGDDAPRLVYADWLDERGDPRGAYLRAEVACPGDADRLRPVATGLDPVWVARVSRPPAGTCCDRVRFRSDYPLPGLIGLNDLERAAAVVLPADYRAFLLNYNGGQPAPRVFQLWGGESGTIDAFFSVARPRPRKAEAWDLEKHLVTVATSRPGRRASVWRHPLGRDIIPIAEGLPAQDWSLVCIGFRRDAIGRVFLVDHYLDTDEPVRPVADSLGEFLDCLADRTPTWLRLIEAGDLAGLVRWLDSGGDLNERYRERPAAAVTPLIQALLNDQPKIVRELIRRRATVPEDLWDTYETLIPHDILPLVDPSRARPNPG
jgi:uncharacterized protein (TIGR02996 family)